MTRLVARHEMPSDDESLALINDADALSFFSLNSDGYANYFGPEQTRKKVAYTWNRLRPGRRHYLRHMRLRGDVREALEMAGLREHTDEAGERASSGMSPASSPATP